jgi:hypothetical protein
MPIAAMVAIRKWFTFIKLCDLVLGYPLPKFHYLVVMDTDKILL